MEEVEVEDLLAELQLPLMRTCARDNIMVTEAFERLAIKVAERLNAGGPTSEHRPVASLSDIKDAGKM